MNLINAGPDHLHPAIFGSLLYEACGRIVNPIYGSVGLFLLGSWQLCQSAVEAVMRGAPIMPIASEVAANGRGAPLKVYDICHVSKDENSAASNDPQRVKTRSRFMRTVVKLKANKGATTTGLGSVSQDSPHEPSQIWTVTNEVVNRLGSHDSLPSDQSEALNAVEGESIDKDRKESKTMILFETAEPKTSMLFRDEPGSVAKLNDRTEDSEDVGLKLTLGFEPASRIHHVVLVKRRRIESKDFGCGSA